MPTPAQLERNVRLYPWYAASVQAIFWLPVFFLYFSSRLPLDRVLQLEAIYYAGVVIMEVPSGYFSDVVGRRTTLMISAICLLASYILFVVDGGFAVFAAAELLLATGFAFNSGTDTAFHNDTFDALGQPDRFAPREAIVARNTFIASAVAALIGGSVAAFDLRLAYVFSAAAALSGFALVLMFTEPAAEHEQGGEAVRDFKQQLRWSIGFLRQPALAWLFAYALIMTVLNHVPYEFFQPYINLAFDTKNLIAASTPLASGVHVFLTMLVGSFFAARSIKLRDRLGLPATLLAATLLQTVIIAVMGVYASVWLIPLILLRSTPRALMAAPLNAAVSPRIPRSVRATYLSIQSLAGRLGFSLLLLGLSTTVGQPVDWATLAHLLHICAIVAAAALLLLAITRRMATR